MSKIETIAELNLVSMSGQNVLGFVDTGWRTYVKDGVIPTQAASLIIAYLNVSPNRLIPTHNFPANLRYFMNEIVVSRGIKSLNSGRGPTSSNLSEGFSAIGSSVLAEFFHPFSSPSGEDSSWLMFTNNMQTPDTAIEGIRWSVQEGKITENEAEILITSFVSEYSRLEDDRGRWTGIWPSNPSSSESEVTPMPLETPVLDRTVNIDNSSKPMARDRVAKKPREKWEDIPLPTVSPEQQRAIVQELYNKFVSLPVGESVDQDQITEALAMLTPADRIRTAHNLMLALNHEFSVSTYGVEQKIRLTRR